MVLGDVLVGQLVLAFAFNEVLGGVDEEHVVGVLALLEYENADGNTGGPESVTSLPPSLQISW